MLSSNVEKEIKNKKEYFKDHVVEVIIESEYVKKYKFSNPNSSEYWFDLVCSDNMIAMMGDCYELMVNPGYGRDGLAFLRGSINSYGYFLEKCRYNKGLGDPLTEYSTEEANENIKRYIEDGYITSDDTKYLYGLDEGQFHGEFRYYEFCSEKQIDEPYSPRVLTSTTMLQIAGLMVFVEKYNELKGESSE